MSLETRLRNTGAQGGGGGVGDVEGPASSTDSVPALFDGTTGKLLKNSPPTGTGNPVLDDSPTFVDDITLASGGPKLLGSGSQLTVTGGGVGGENLILTLSGGTNLAELSTSTGVTQIRQLNINHKIDSSTSAYYFADRGSSTQAAAIEYQTIGVAYFTAGLNPSVHSGSNAFYTITDGANNIMLDIEDKGTTSEVTVNGELIVARLTASELVATDSSDRLVSLAVATYPSLAEIAHVKGVTSAVQTQLDASALLAGRSGGQVLIGGTDAADDLTLRATAGVGAGSENIIFQVGSNGATEAGRFTHSGGLHIGGTTDVPASNFKVSSAAGVILFNATGESVTVERATGNTGAFDWDSRKARGTIASPTVVSNGDNLGNFIFRGHDGANYIIAAEILSAVDGTPGTNDMPGELSFHTTPDGAASPLERMTIHADGGLVLLTAAGNEPTGGSKAAGTLNAKALYDDGTIVADYVFDIYFDGKSKPGTYQPDDLSGYKIPSIDEFSSHLKEKRHLPRVKSRDEWVKTGKPPLGELMSQLLEQLEHQALYIMELNERVKSLEDRIQR